MKRLYRFLTITAWIGLLAIAFISFGNRENSPETGASLNFRENLNDFPKKAATEAKVYSIDKNESELTVRLYKKGIFSGFAHDHIVIAREFSGSVEFDEVDPTEFKISVEVPANSIASDLPEIRRKYGLEVLSQKDWIEINKTMRSSRQLDIEKYPIVRFSSDSFKRIEGESFEITGEFSLHGGTKLIAVPVTISVENGILKLQGEFSFLQSDITLNPSAVPWGLLEIKMKHC
ncbi:MAG: YceI family protein [Flavobacteriaceae bacterium]|nr:YceI family protein [Flavobacteriaceae bacterium]